jgi:hypothetical protein
MSRTPCTPADNTSSTPIGGAPAGAPPSMHAVPTVADQSSHSPAWRPSNTASSGIPASRPLAGHWLRHRRPRSNALYNRCAMETGAREASRIARQTYWSEAPFGSWKGADFSRLLADHRSWLSPRTEGIPPGQRPDGGPGRTFTSDFILVSNLQLSAMRTAVFPGDPRTSRAKLSSVTACSRQRDNGSSEVPNQGQLKPCALPRRQPIAALPAPLLICQYSHRQSTHQPYAYRTDPQALAPRARRNDKGMTTLTPGRVRASPDPPVVQEVVDLAVERRDLAVAGTAALPGWVSSAEEPLALKESLQVLLAAPVWPGDGLHLRAGPRRRG